MSFLGQDVIDVGSTRVGQKYVLGAQVSLDNNRAKSWQFASMTYAASIAIALMAPSAAFAAGPGEADPAKLMTQLSGLLVIATVMESALSTIFNWKLYKEFFNNRGVKTLVMIVFGLLVVTQFSYDIFHDIVVNAGGADNKGFISTLLSVLVLAGGSAAIHELFKALGLRSPVEAPEAKPRPNANTAWASVKILRDQTAADSPEEVKIHFDLIKEPTADQKAIPPLAGTIAKKNFRQRLRGVFLVDPMRLPAYGGRTLEADQVYRIAVSGVRVAENRNDPPVRFLEDIYVGRFAGGAIVDFTYKI